jgi:hypothetical protein
MVSLELKAVLLLVYYFLSYHSEMCAGIWLDIGCYLNGFSKLHLRFVLVPFQFSTFEIELGLNFQGTSLLGVTS